MKLFSNELKKQAGYGKDGEKGFDGAVANLMMQMYICNCDFRKRINKRGEQYGWDVACLIVVGVATAFATSAQANNSPLFVASMLISISE